MPVLINLVHKELLLQRRDLHGLLLLFAMPCIFILIMSFALSERMDGRSSPLGYLLADEDSSEASASLAAALDAQEGIHRVASPGDDLQSMLERVRGDQVQFLLLIRENYQQHLAAGELALRLYVAPSTEGVLTQVFSALVREQVMKTHLNKLAELTGGAGNFKAISTSLDTVFKITSLYTTGIGEITPSSVQQSVPAWLLFAMFFISIPLSTTIVRERSQGTLMRLRSMGVSHSLLLLGKLLPYIMINLLQVAAMLAIGVYLIPALGGGKLEILGSLWALLLVAVASSLAAVSYGLCVAQLAQTIEQATIVAGVFNIIMAAVGGIMVPRYVMPPVMQDLSVFSPMAWGLDGFLEIILRSGDVKDVAPDAMLLTGFAVILLALASVLAKRHEKR
jgi:ABC-2 type transport system permease protein